MHDPPQISETSKTPVSLVLKIPRRLESPNKSRGAHWRVRHQITQVWEQEIGWAIVAMQAQQHGADVAETTRYLMKWAEQVAREMPIPRRMRVSVERHVPSRRNFIQDDDNLRFSVKPLLDALKRQGYIKNDSRKWLEHPTPTQHVSEDGKDYTIVTIEPVEDAEAVR